MSSFISTFINLTTNEPVRVLCLDNAFGRHQYGYQVEGTSTIITEEEFSRQYKFK